MRAVLNTLLLSLMKVRFARSAQLGFAIADLAYQPQPHIPGPNVPHLEMVALVLNLLSGMWLAREETESYLSLLPTLNAVRHSGWQLTPKRSVGPSRARPWDVATWPTG